MSVREADESVTGSANFFALIRPERDPPLRPFPFVGSDRVSAVHLRQPASNHRTSSLLWGIGLGLYVWIGLIAVDVAKGTAFLFGLLSAVGIFFLVLRLGGERYKS